MKIVLAVLAVLVSLFVVGLAHAAPQEPLTAFVDVSVVPMDRERVLEHQTVIVRGPMIIRVGPARSTRPPHGALVIDGRGGWLMPGLADMHTHVDNPADFPLLLAAGVTTTLNMGGASEAYRGPIREAIRDGRMIGPNVLTGLMIDGPGDPGASAVKPRDETEARRYVRSARSRGYDYIKIYSRLAPDIFAAIMDEAARQHMPVVGHVVRSVGLKAGLDHGQVMIAHAEEYLTVFDDAPPRDQEIPALVDLTVQSHATVTANISGLARIAEQWGRPDQVRKYLDSEDARLLRPAIRAKWRDAAYARLDGSYTAESMFCDKLVAALHAGGVPILIGTDTPDIPGVPPGRSAIDEITALKAVGFSNYDSLAAATVVAGTFVHATLPAAERFGIVAPKHRADLVLLAANPLASLDALRRPRGVMIRGRWQSADRLRAAVEAAAYEADQTAPAPTPASPERSSSSPPPA